MLLLWLGGFWRTWLPLLAVALWLAVALANATAPGVAHAALRRLMPRAVRSLPTGLALLVAAISLLLSVGVFTTGSLIRGAVIFALQLGLFPWTPPLLALALCAAWLLWLDAHRQRGLDFAAESWARRWPPARRLLARLVPPLLAAALAGSFAAALFPQAMRGWTRADGPDAQAYHLYRAFFNYSIYEDDRLEHRSGFQLGLRGLTLPPGEAGEIVFRLNRPTQSIVLLRADFYNRRLAASGTSMTDDTFPNRLELSTGGPFQTLLENASLGEIVGGHVLDLSGLLGDARTYRLRLTAHNTTGGEVTVLPAFTISTTADPTAVPHPTFPVVAYVALAAAVTCALVRRRPALALTAGTAAGAALVCVAWLAARAAPTDVTALSGQPALTFDPSHSLDVEYALRAARALTAASCAAAIVWALAARQLRDRPVAPAVLACACALTAVVALDARWQELIRTRYDVLLPDAGGYQAIAAEFPIKMARYRSERPSELLEALYDSGFDGKASAAAVFYAGGNNGREPGWPALLRLTFNLLGVSSFHTRLTSLLIASLCAGLTCWLGWRWLHPLAGLTGGLLYALNYPQIVNSVGGLREEAVALCFLTLVAALYLPSPNSPTSSTPRPTRTRLAVAGLASGYLILIRADMLVLAGLVITLAAIALRWRPKEWLLACALCGALAGPMYVGYAFTHRDPFYPGTYGATVNRNLEFPERMGTPGFPTAEEFAANWAAGPRISPMTYFFGYHSIPQFVEYSMKGFIRIFPTILFRDQPIQLWVFVAGMPLLLLRRLWLIPGIVVVSLAPFYAFMAGVPNPWVFAPRYAHHTLPFAVLAAAYAVWFVPQWLYTRRAQRTERTGTPAQPVHVSDLRTALS